MPTEPVPINAFLTDVQDQWTYSNVAGTIAKPAFVEVTGDDEPMRFNLNVNDHFVGRAGSPALEETPIGNWNYANKSTLLVRVVAKVVILYRRLTEFILLIP